MLADELPKGRIKVIHTVGSIAKTEYISTNDHPYTGVFKGRSQAILLASLAIEADPSIKFKDGAKTNFNPTFGLKFLRDRFPSANLLVLYSSNGQNSWNFFKNNFSN